jgi:predicted ATPase
MISKLAISGYRSIRDLRVELGQLNVVTGANGSGKSSVYRALRLLAEIAQGRAIPTLAGEGGLKSTLWAGPETISRAMKSGEMPIQGSVRKNPISLQMGFSGPEYGYAIDIGLPKQEQDSLFNGDPEIKTESLWTGETLGRSNEFAIRRGYSVRIRAETGSWRNVFDQLSPSDSMLTHCSDPQEAMELLVLRERLKNWRFYDHFRTDRDAPARKPQVGTRTAVMASDGADFCSALQTIRGFGNDEMLNEAIEDAFPNSSVGIVQSDTYFDLEMQQNGLLRRLKASELSDGTLRYLLLVAALLSPSPPELMILNEPETSLYPELIPPLARLITTASRRSQMIVVTHSLDLADELAGHTICNRIHLEKSFGETLAKEAEKPIWVWPVR